MVLLAPHIKLDLRQVIKLVIYTLLLINFSFYITDDIRVASFTMRNGGDFLKWTESFATTIDESAWFILLFLFELETYLLSDEVQKRRGVMWLLHGFRLVCYASLTHSVYAFSNTYFDLIQVVAIDGVTDLCQLVERDLSFVRNLAYTDLSLANCSSLSTAAQFFYAEPGLVVTDGSGLALERNLALADIVEVVAWLIILFTIELMVWLQDRSITRGTLVTAIKYSKLMLYTTLWCLAGYWLSLGHIIFAWDEALWIIGFFAIEMNVNEWKKEIEDAGDTNTAAL